MAFYYTYVLSCYLEEKEYFYVGYTPNLEVRFRKHCQGQVKSTAKYKSHKLIYYEACRDKKDAISREKSLKTGFGRGFIKNRIKYYLLSRD